MSTPTTSLQGALRVPTACTIRVTYNPGGLGTTSDLVVAAGTYYQSHTAFLDAWTTQLAADVPGTWTFTTTRVSGRGRVTLAAIPGPALDFEIAWSHTGDGTAIRDWLGETGDVADSAPYVFLGYMQAAYFPELGAQLLQRAAAWRPMTLFTALDASSQTQSNTSHSDADEVEGDAVVTLGPTDWLADGQAFALFLSDLTTYAADEHFSIVHGIASTHGYMPDEQVRIAAERVQPDWDTLWRIPFRFRSARAEA